MLSQSERMFQEKMAILNENFLRYLQKATRELPDGDLSPTVKAYISHVHDLDELYGKSISPPPAPTIPLAITTLTDSTSSSTAVVSSSSFLFPSSISMINKDAGSSILPLKRSFIEEASAGGKKSKVLQGSEPVFSTPNSGNIRPFDNLLGNTAPMTPSSVLVQPSIITSTTSSSSSAAVVPSASALFSLSSSSSLNNKSIGPSLFPLSGLSVPEVTVAEKISTNLQSNEGGNKEPLQRDTTPRSQEQYQPIPIIPMAFSTSKPNFGNISTLNELLGKKTPTTSTPTVFPSLSTTSTTNSSFTAAISSSLFPLSTSMNNKDVGVSRFPLKRLFSDETNAVEKKVQNSQVSIGEEDEPQPKESSSMTEVAGQVEKETIFSKFSTSKPNFVNLPTLDDIRGKKTSTSTVFPSALTTSTTSNSSSNTASPSSFSLFSSSTSINNKSVFSSLSTTSTTSTSSSTAPFSTSSSLFPLVSSLNNKLVGSSLFSSSAAEISAGEKTATNSQDTKDGEEETEEDTDPPRPEVVEQVEKGAVYHVKSAVYGFIDGKFEKKGVGFLSIKEMDGSADNNDGDSTSKRHQMIIRAATATGLVWTNIFLNPDMKWKKADATRIQISYPKTGSCGETLLLRLANSSELDQLVKVLAEHGTTETTTATNK